MDRPYSLDWQREQNEIFAARINKFWAEKGIDAGARVEEKTIKIPQFSGALKSYEIVSNIHNFPFIKREVMGIQ